MHECAGEHMVCMLKVYVPSNNYTDSSSFLIVASKSEPMELTTPQSQVAFAKEEGDMDQEDVVMTSFTL